MTAETFTLKYPSFSMWVWVLELINFYAMLTCCMAAAIERQCSFHGHSLKDTLVQYFNIKGKRHLKVCPPLLGVHKNSKYTWVYDAVMQSLTFCVIGSISISPIPFLPSATYIVLEQPYTLLQIASNSLKWPFWQFAFFKKNKCIHLMKIISERTLKINNGRMHCSKLWKRNWCSIDVQLE